ncbi:MAG: response regulator [Patescibacteria group bacterium]
MDKKIKLLIIEDDLFLLNMYASKFELEGFDVVLAEDGEKGWKTTIKEVPDIILLDIMMPKMNGFEVLEKLKSDDRVSMIPVILLTNLSQKDEIERAMNLGAADFLIKAHFRPSEVVEKIKKLLNLEQ